jgi:hypothetical protein
VARHAAEQSLSKVGPNVRADDQEVGTLRLGHANDDVTRIAARDLLDGEETRLGEVSAGAREHRERRARLLLFEVSGRPRSGSS